VFLDSSRLDLLYKYVLLERKILSDCDLGGHKCKKPIKKTKEVMLPYQKITEGK
jgi:hypothetical protein